MNGPRPALVSQSCRSPAAPVVAGASAFRRCLLRLRLRDGFLRRRLLLRDLAPPLPPLLPPRPLVALALMYPPVILPTFVRAIPHTPASLAGVRHLFLPTPSAHSVRRRWRGGTTPFRLVHRLYWALDADAGFFPYPFQPPPPPAPLVTNEGVRVLVCATRCPPHTARPTLRRRHSGPIRLDLDVQHLFADWPFLIAFTCWC